MEEHRRVNMITGTVGAFVGVLIGVALYVGIYQMGYIAGIAGAVMMICSIKGFELLGKGLNVPGIIICILMVIVAVYLANSISVAVQIMTEWKYSFGTAYKQIKYLLQTNRVFAESYYKNLFMGYGLTIIAIIPSIRDFVKGRRQSA